MKHTPYIIIALLIAFIYFLQSQNNRNQMQQETAISILRDSVQHARQSAQRYRALSDLQRDRMASFQAVRDTIYQERVRVVTRWRDKPAQSDSERLDSCVEVGSIVLLELAACDSALTACKGALTLTDTAYIYIDSAVVTLQRIDTIQAERLAKVTKQRDRARWWALAGWGVALSAIGF